MYQMDQFGQGHQPEVSQPDGLDDALNLWEMDTVFICPLVGAR